MQKKSILKILGENDKNIKMRKIWGVVLVGNTVQHADAVFFAGQCDPCQKCAAEAVLYNRTTELPILTALPLSLG